MELFVCLVQDGDVRLEVCDEDLGRDGAPFLDFVFEDLTDVTLVDEDTKSILTDNANRAIQGNQAMHVT